MKVHRRTTGQLAAAVAALVMGLSVSPAAQASMTWVTTGWLNTARYQNTATLLPNGKALVAGGLGSDGAAASAELYDPASGTWTATGSLTGVKIWSTETWKPIKELPVNGNAVCAFTPDGQWLLTSSGEEYCLWSADTWEPRLKLPRDHAGDMPGGIVFSGDARLAALLDGRNRGVKLISIPDGRELAFLDTGEPLCFSRDGSLLATTSEDHRNVLVWDLRLIRQELRALGLPWD